MRTPSSVSVVRDHLREPHVVVEGADEASPATEEERRRARAVTERSQDRLACAGPRHVERREAIGLLVSAPERRVGHAERAADALFDEVAERLTRCHLDDAAQHVGRHRVVPLGARLEEEWDRGPRVARTREVEPFGCAELEPRLPVQVVDAARVEEAVGQTRRVREEVEHRHRLLLRHRARVVRRALRVHASVRERGDELGHWVGELELALLEQDHRGDRGDRLAHGEEAVDRVELDWRSGLEVALAVGLEVRGLPVA